MNTPFYYKWTHCCITSQHTIVLQVNTIFYYKEHTIILQMNTLLFYKWTYWYFTNKYYYFSSEIQQSLGATPYFSTGVRFYRSRCKFSAPLSVRVQGGCCPWPSSATRLNLSSSSTSHAKRANAAVTKSFCLHTGTMGISAGLNCTAMDENRFDGQV